MLKNQLKRTKQTLIGDLLARAGLITRQDLTNCLTKARQSGLPIGQVLIINSFVSEEELSAGLRVQALIRDGLLPEDQGIDALIMVRGRKISLEKALEQQGWKSEYHAFTQSLGKLLIEAQAVKQEQLDEALNVCHTSGLPLARVLVLQGALSEFVAYAALTAQSLIRDKKIARDQAVGALRLTVMHGDSIEDYLEFGGLRKIRPDHVLRLGEMLVLSELVNELDLLSAVETGLMEAQPIGHILMESNEIPQQVVEAGLKLQDLIRENKVDPMQAVDILKQCALTHKSVEELAQDYRPPQNVVQELPEKDARLLEFVHGLAFLSDSGLQSIVEELIKTGTDAEEYLRTHDIVSIEKIETAKKCRELVENKTLTLEQGIFAVHIWMWKGGQFESVLRDIGWLS